MGPQARLNVFNAAYILATYGKPIAPAGGRRLMSVLPPASEYERDVDEDALSSRVSLRGLLRGAST
jgi:hypothetical protein